MDVFISYHRGNDGSAIAQLIELKLKMLGYTVFLDYNSLKKGEFDRQILQRIRAAKAFLLICTPTALDNCMRPDSWVRWEIRQALESGIPIIPVLMDGFHWDRVMLPADIDKVRYHHGINLDFEYIDPGIERLCHLMDFSPEGNLDAMHPAAMDDAKGDSFEQKARGRTSPSPRRRRGYEKIAESRPTHPQRHQRSHSRFFIISILVCVMVVVVCFFVTPRRDDRSYQPRSSAEWEHIKTSLAFGASIKDHTYPFHPQMHDYWAFAAAEDGLLEIIVQRSEDQQTNDLLLVLLGENQQVLKQAIVPQEQAHMHIHWQIDAGRQFLYLKFLDRPVYDQQLQVHLNFDGEEAALPRGATDYLPSDA